MKAEEIDRFPKQLIVTVDNKEEYDKILKLCGSIEHKNKTGGEE